jgi:hypothetical protein
MNEIIMQYVREYGMAAGKCVDGSAGNAQRMSISR